MLAATGLVVRRHKVGLDRVRAVEGQTYHSRWEQETVRHITNVVISQQATEASTG